MRYVVATIGIIAVVGGLVAVKGAQISKLIAFGKAAQQAGPPPEAVSTAIAEEQSWEGAIAAIGNVATARGVAVSTDVPGVVTRIHFESGATVKEGQVLVELDSSVERAQLASAVARRQLATTTAQRSRALVAQGAISAAQTDNDESALRTATTDAEAIQAAISKKTIRAPFAGKVGIRSVNVGQFLNPGTPVAVLEAVDAAHVDFTLPQQRLSEITIGMPVRVILEGDAGAAVDGKIAALDPTVDPVTRNIKLRADLAKQETLRPGMFVNVEVLLPKKESHVSVPLTAVVHAPYGDSVFIVESKDGGKVARQQFVRVGRARGDFVAILDGVKPKEEIVVQGAFKLRNNAAVAVDNSKKSKPELDPRPENR